MKTSRFLFLLVIAALVLPSVVVAQDMMYSQAPMLDDMVASGDLPPVEERLPAEPLVVDGVEGVGQYGGTWRIGSRGGLDGALYTRAVGYEGLVVWDWEWTEVIPNVASGWEVNEEGTEFTFNLREGMKWSDGVDFTANDILFWYEAVASNREIRPAPPSWMVTEGEFGSVEAVDDTTVKFIFSAPNGLFLQRLATPDGLQVIKFPAHWFSKYHPDYNPDGYEQYLDEFGLDTWVDVFDVVDEEWDIADKPTLNAWILKSPQAADATQVSFERNPYYWKVDSEGKQYPYFDYIQSNVGEDTETLTLRALNGDIDMQDRHIATLGNKAIFFDNMEAGGYRFYNLIGSSMNTVAIALNLTHEDPTMREIFNTKDFRVALSYAINRQEIIDVVYVSQGEPYQLAPRPTSPLYNERLAKQYTEYDPDLANEMLDALYPEKDGEGFRLGPDGARITFSIDVISINQEWQDSIELVTSYWNAVGIDARMNVIDRSIMYDRKDANQQDANVWGGDGGLDVILEPRWYFPFSGESNFAPLWRYYYEGNPLGEAPPEDSIAWQQWELYDTIRVTPDQEKQNELMAELLDLSADAFWAIGISLPAPGYGIVKTNMHNVPETYPGAWLYPNPGPTKTFTYFYSDEM